MHYELVKYEVVEVAEKNWELKVEIVKTSKKKQVSTSMFKQRSRKKESVNLLPLSLSINELGKGS